MNKMSLEEEALRHADKFFSEEHRWWHGYDPYGPYDPYIHPDATCVGVFLEKFRREHGPKQRDKFHHFRWSSKVMNVSKVIAWNDALPSFKAMKSALKARIKYYRNMRA